MLKKIKELSEVRSLSKNAQKKIQGGRISIEEACSDCSYYVTIVPYLCYDPGYICCWNEGVC